MSVDKNMNVLIVDDYKTMLRIIRNLLRQLGFVNIDEATDGSMALQMMRGANYGLVISDWNMEPMTGLQLLREVRSRRETQEYPVHYGHRGVQVRERGRGEGSGRLQLYRQALQRRNPASQDGQRSR